MLAADLDPQADLSAAFLREYRQEDLWPAKGHRDTIFGSVAPLMRGLGDVRAPHVEEICPNLGLLVGDLGLSLFEAPLSSTWTDCLERDKSAFRIQSALHRTILHAARTQEADLTLIDVGPNLGAINRAAIIAADFVVFPLAPNLFGVPSLRDIGPTFRGWVAVWRDRLDRRPQGDDLELPSADVSPAGYIVMQHGVRTGNPVLAYRRWSGQIPEAYRKHVLAGASPSRSSKHGDSACLATLGHYRSLMWMARDARKPMFHLRAADGALGGHIYAVQDCYSDFERLARTIAARCSIQVSNE